MLADIFTKELQFIIFSFLTPVVLAVTFFVKTSAYYIEFSFIVDIVVSACIDGLLVSTIL